VNTRAAEQNCRVVSRRDPASTILNLSYSGLPAPARLAHRIRCRFDCTEGSPPCRCNEWISPGASEVTDNVRDVDSLENVAHHEAGHAVAAHVLGCRIKSCSCTEGTEDTLGSMPYSRGLHPQGIEWLRTRSVISQAGPAASHIGGFLATGDEHDWWDTYWRHWRAVEDLAWTGSFERWLADAKLTAGDIVRQHWQGVQRLAGVLMERGCVPGPLVHAIFAQTLAGVQGHISDEAS